MLDVEFLEGWGLLGGGDPVGQVRVFLAQLVECVVDLQGAVAADPETVGPCEGVAPETFSLSFPVGWVGDDLLVDGVAVLFGEVGEPDTDSVGDLLLQTEQLPTGETDLVADAVVIDCQVDDLHSLVAQHRPGHVLVQGDGDGGGQAPGFLCGTLEELLIVLRDVDRSSWHEISICIRILTNCRVGPNVEAHRPAAPRIRPPRSRGAVPFATRRPGRSPSHREGKRSPGPVV